MKPPMLVKWQQFARLWRRGVGHGRFWLTRRGGGRERGVSEGEEGKGFGREEKRRRKKKNLQVQMLPIFALYN